MNNALKIILIILLLVFLYLVRNIVAIVFFSIIIAAAVSPVSEWFDKHKIPKVLGVLFIYLIALSVLGLAFYLVVPTMISEMGNFANTFPTYLEQFTSSKNIQQVFPSLPSSVSEILGEAALKLKDILGQFRQDFFQTASAIFGAVVGGAYPTTEQAQARMTGVKAKVYRPNAAAAAVYAELYGLYRLLHDAFGTPTHQGEIASVMKRLIALRNRIRKG